MPDIMMPENRADRSLQSSRVSTNTYSRAIGWIMPVSIAAITAATFANGISGPFVFDDIPELLQNPDIRSLPGCLDTISRSSDTGLAGRPAACLTFALNYVFSGPNVRGFHLLNVLIHILAALILFGVLRRTIERSQKAISAAPDTLVLCIAVLWAVHPLQTESVTYVIQRIESLAGLWYLLTLYCVARSSNSEWDASWKACAVVCCAMGMLTKEIVATAPLIVLLYDYTFFNNPIGAALRRSKGLYVGLGLTWLIPISIIAGGSRGGTVGFNLGVSPLDYLLTQAGVILHYLSLCFWPYVLAISYADWHIVRHWNDAVPELVIVAGLLVVTAIGVWRRASWGFAGAWFFIILAPSSSFVPIVTEPAAERRMYLPLAAVVALVVVAADRAISGLTAWIGAGAGTRRSVKVGICLVVVGALGARTVVRNADYASGVGLLSKTLAVRPGDELVRGALIEELIRGERLADARKVHAEGLIRNPASYVLFHNWGQCMMIVGRHDEAQSSFEKALGVRSNDYAARSGLGTALAEQGRWRDAVEQLREGIRLRPGAYRAHSNLGVALANLGEKDEAIKELRLAVRLKPGFADAQYNLGQLLLERGETREAVVHLRAALRMEPQDTGIAMVLGEALEKSGNLDEAVGQYRAILAREADNREALERLQRLVPDAGRQ